MKRFVVFDRKHFKIYARADTLGDAIRKMMIKAKFSTREFEVDDLEMYGVSSEEEWTVCKLLGMTTDHVVRV